MKKLYQKLICKYWKYKTKNFSYQKIFDGCTEVLYCLKVINFPNYRYANDDERKLYITFKHLSKEINCTPDYFAQLLLLASSKVV